MTDFLAAILECIADRVKEGETIESAMCNVARNLRDSKDHIEGGTHENNDTLF